MNILQIHLELSDIPPKDTVRFEGETTSFEICVENSKNPIRFKAKQQNYCYKKNRYSKVELEPYQIVNMYRCENLHKGAQKIDKEDVERYSQEPGNLVYSQDEIYCNSDDLKCYNKVVLVPIPSPKKVD